MRDSVHPALQARPAFGRRFWPLFAAGSTGVLALPLIVMPALEARLRAGAPEWMSLPVLVALAMVQPAVLLAAGAALGAALAPRLGLTSHLANVNVRGAFASELPLALIGGALTGAVIVLVDILAFGTGYAGSTNAFAAIVRDLIPGLMYGGITEEIMMRWGLLSLVVWAGTRLLRRSAERPVIVAAIVIVAVLFGAGHLPAAAAVAPLTVSAVIRILLLNGLAGLVFGWLFWQRSLESAMVAHASVHVVFALARVLAAS